MRRLAALLILTALAGCSSSGGTAADPPPASAPVTSAAASSAPGLPTVGQSVTLHEQDGVERVTLLATWRRGRVFAVRLRVTNVSGKLDDGPWISSALADAVGQQYDPGEVQQLAAGTQLPGTVDPPAGDSVVGWLPFRLPTSARPARLKWQAGGFGDTAWWRL